MSSKEFFFRIFLSLVIFIFGVAVWGIAPYGRGAFSGGLDVSFLSIFFGNADIQGWSAAFLLLSRISMSMALISWILIPALNYAVYADFRPLVRACILFFLLLAAFAFFASLTWHFLFNI